MRYITVEEYLGPGVTVDKLSAEENGNLAKLIPAINEFLEAFKEYRAIISGRRSMEHHLEIYKKKNEELKKKGLSPVTVPLASKHLYSAAVDLEDSNGKLKEFAKNNVKLLEKLGLYCEALESTPTWLHLQILPPRSGNRFFIP